MGAILNLVWTLRREKINDFSGHTGDVGMVSLRAQDGSRVRHFIDADSPTPSNFNSFDDGTVVPNSSVLVDNVSGKWYIKTGATTWTVIGSVT